jgi:ABC-type spermidine/putrescine transport system permease subunit II
MPSLYLVLWAFFGSETVGVLDRAPKIRWFVSLYADPEWRSSIAYSLVLAALVSMVSSLVLIVHFYFMRYAAPPLEILAYATTILPVIIPQVIYALALKLFGGRMGVPELVLVFVGHLIFILPLQFFVLEAAQETIPTELLFAGNTLGASHLKNVVFNYFLLMKRPVVVSFLVGFFFSFDELVIATFVIDSPMVTVARRLWDQVHRSMVPFPAVVACSLLGVYVLLLIVVWTISRVKRQVRFRRY